LYLHKVINVYQSTQFQVTGNAGTKQPRLNVGQCNENKFDKEQSGLGAGREIQIE